MVTDMVMDQVGVTDMVKDMDLKAAITMVKDMGQCMDMARDTAENTIVALAERESWR